MSVSRRKRLLPKYVTSFPDRHGKERLRFRRKGFADHYFKHKFGTEGFRTEYRACLDGTAPDVESPKRWAPGSIGNLVTRYCKVATRLGPTEVTQSKVRAVIHRFRDEFGEHMVDAFEFEHIDAIIEAKREKVVIKGKKHGGIFAARKLRKELVRLFDFAKKLRIRTDNPAMDSEHVKTGPGQKSTGYYTWTEVDIAQYRKRHPLGTSARLALELLLWTGQRRSDVRGKGPDDISDGRIKVIQEKGGKELWIPLAPQLLAAISACPAPEGADTFLVTEFGKAFSRAGFGNKMRQWCDDAGLPKCSAHGLRKAIMRRMAELNMGNQTLKSVSGHTRDDEVALYTAGADQKRMAGQAIAALADWEVSNLEKKLDVSASQTPVNGG